MTQKTSCSLALAATLLLPAGAVAQQDAQAVQTTLLEFMQCREDDPVNDRSPCNRFVGQALEQLFCVDDFRVQGSNGQYLLAREIEAWLELSDDWIALGEASDQAALDEAQGSANVRRAVVAAGRGHVALIIPGSQVPSGSWGLRVPNSASFRLDDVNASYVGKGLSYAWSSPNDVKLYGRAHTDC